MLNTSINVTKREAAGFEPLQPDVYQVELYDIEAVEKETFDSKTGKTLQKEFETVLNFQFTLLEGDNRAVRSVWANFVPTYLYISKKTGKNKLYKIIEALIGRELQESELVMNETSLNTLIGKQCRIVVENRETPKGTFNNITNWVKASTNLPSLTAEEKEKARVKRKPANKEITADEIPF